MDFNHPGFVVSCKRQSQNRLLLPNMVWNIDIRSVWIHCLLRRHFSDIDFGIDRWKTRILSHRVLDGSIYAAWYVDIKEAVFTAPASSNDSG
jgi:hypothetical protein